MRKLALLLTAVAAAAATSAVPPPAKAAEYLWCAQYGTWGGGGRNCGFVSYQQCMATISGIGGSCIRSPYYRGPEPRGERRTYRY